MRFADGSDGGGFGAEEESWGPRVEEAERKAHQESSDEELQQDGIVLPLEKLPPWLPI